MGALVQVQPLRVARSFVRQAVAVVRRRVVTVAAVLVLEVP